MRIWILISEVLLVMASSVAASQISVRAVPAPEYEALFHREECWIGADGDYSIALDEDTVVWLFSDTFIGKINNNRRTDAVMINNSVAVQKLRAKRVDYYYQADASGRPRSFIVPDDGRGYFWLWDGAITSKGLYLFLARIEHSSESSVFPFKMVGMDVTRVVNPLDPPRQWRFDRQRALPFCRFTDDRTILFGSATLKPIGNDVYIYGLDGHKDTDGERHSYMIVARVPRDRLGDFSEWRFLTKGRWTSDYEECDHLFDGAPTEFSVSYVPGIKQYAAVYTEGGIFGQIVVRLAPKPEGPWGPEMRVFDCPDRTWHKHTYSYAVKAHPELSTKQKELIVTYATNSAHFPDLFDDARLYWPRFVRLTFGD